MNLIVVAADSGRIVHPAFSLGVDRAAPGKVTLGQRPEDMRITTPEKGDFRGEVFSAELLGDAALITVRLGSDFIAVKAEKDCPARMGDVVGVAFDTASLHIFDGATGERLPDSVETHSKVARLPTSRR